MSPQCLHRRRWFVLAPGHNPHSAHSFDLKFRAAGFRQYVREAPRLTSAPVLSDAERGGCRFTEVGFG
ncbi:hypothetical protein ACIRRH_26170 [Kitasatospora sp. NPDC101235]|uniref:hypothetical protein n=1 Tax=Kitasatospora sp. NPDC101235 TaxID=3364101 RepID=UPI00382C950C